MDMHRIMVIRVGQRLANAEHLQGILSRFGCIIKVRLGLHEAGDACAPDGLIVLQLTQGDAEPNELLEQLNLLPGIQAKLVEI